MTEIQSAEDLAQNHANALSQAIEDEQTGPGFDARTTNIRAVPAATDACVGSAEAASLLSGMVRSLASDVASAHSSLANTDLAKAGEIGEMR